MTTIAEHTIDLSLLPEQAKIMDAGCRGFLFTDEMRRLGHLVYAIDIDLLWPRQHYLCAIAGHTGKCSVQRDKDPQATRMMPGFDIQCYTIPDFSKMVDVDFWDAVKLDVEGAEYEIIMSLEKAPGKQISLEMHLHTGLYTMKEAEKMVSKLKALGYCPAQHELTKAHGLGYNYWDSLFILKD